MRFGRSSRGRDTPGHVSRRVVRPLDARGSLKRRLNLKSVIEGLKDRPYPVPFGLRFDTAGREVAIKAAQAIPQARRTVEARLPLRPSGKDRVQVVIAEQAMVPMGLKLETELGC